MKKWIPYALLSLLSAGVAIPSTAKSPKKAVTITVKGHVVHAGAGLEGATVRLLKDKDLVGVMVTGDKAKYILELEMNQHYTIEVIADGLVSKRLLFKTYLPEGVERSLADVYSFDIDLFTQAQENKLLDIPVCVISYDKELGVFRDLYSYTQHMREVQKRLLGDQNQPVSQHLGD